MKLGCSTLPALSPALNRACNPARGRAFGLVNGPILALAVAVGTSTLAAQVPAAAGPQPADPTLKISPEKVLESFEPAVDAEYELGPGDVITVNAPGRTELTGKHTIGPDGRITLSVGDSIHIAGLSRSAASKAIQDALAPYYTSLTVTVSVDKYSSNRVQVLGYVLHPGEVLFDGTPTLLDAISRAGLISGTMDKSGVPVKENAIPETCTIYRGNATAVQVNLRSLLMSGNTLANLRLRRADIVYVPAPQELFVSVMGAVGHAGTFPLTPSSTLVSILAEAGCCGDPAGNSPTIHVIQPSTSRDTKISYKELISLKGTNEITLHTGDIIVVPKTKFYQVTDVLQRISPIATMVTLGALVGGG